MVKIVIIGLGTAGFAAALAIKKQDRSAKITFIDQKDFDLLHVCGLPYVLERKLHSFSKLKHNVNSMMGIEIIRSKATTIDTAAKTVRCGSEVSYDKLIICVGSYSFIPAIDGTDNNKHIFTVSKISDTEKLDNEIGNCQSAVIIGAGAIGIETAHALKVRGLDVTVVDMYPSVFPKSIDPDMSEIVEDYLVKKGIKLKLGVKLKKIDGNQIDLDDEKLTSDIIVMATGVRPRVKLAGDSGILTDKTGIVINDKMQTDIDSIFAAGDCVTVKSIITKKHFPAWLATTAYKQGTIAGINASGGSARLKGTTATFVSVVGGLEIASTGLNTFLAKENGFDYITGKAKSTDLPDWMPGGEDITVKIIADKKTGKIIGGQAVGRSAAAKINVISTAISSGMRLSQLRDVEFAYCPAVSQAYDVLSAAVEVALRKG
ncbi:MAG: FAD-dependent oxidoreductase [Nanoarchaeota archaeon]